MYSQALPSLLVECMSQVLDIAMTEYDNELVKIVLLILTLVDLTYEDLTKYKNICKIIKQIQTCDSEDVSQLAVELEAKWTLTIFEHFKKVCSDVRIQELNAKYSMEQQACIEVKEYKVNRKVVINEGLNMEFVFDKDLPVCVAELNFGINDIKGLSDQVNNEIETNKNNNIKL